MACTKVADLDGAYTFPFTSEAEGSFKGNAEIQVRLDPANVGLSLGHRITDLRAYAAVGTLAQGGVVESDEVVLPDATVSRWDIAVALAPRGAAEEDVAFDRPVPYAPDGGFSAALDASGLPAPLDAWVRVCLGESCEAVPVPVRGEQPSRRRRVLIDKEGVRPSAVSVSRAPRSSNIVTRGAEQWSLDSTHDRPPRHRHARG